MDKARWNEIFSSPDYMYGKEPNVFLREQLSKLEPGDIIFPAEGEGRNAVWAASKGWKVSAFDQSEEGRSKALKLAKDLGVTIDYRICDIAGADFPQGSFDVLALIFAHTPEIRRRTIHRSLLRFLRPGGKLILEGYSKEQLQYMTGGPKDLSLLFTEEDIRKDFEETEILYLEKVLTVLDEGTMHKGNSSVIRLLAIKK